MTEKKDDVSQKFKDKLAQMPYCDLKSFIKFIEGAEYPNRIHAAAMEELTVRTHQVIDEDSRAQLAQTIQEKYFELYPTLKEAGIELHVRIYSRHKSITDVGRVKWFLGGTLHITTQEQNQILKEVHNYHRPFDISLIAEKYGILFSGFDVEKTFTLDWIMDLQKIEFKKADDRFEDLELNCTPFDYFQAGWQACHKLHQKLKLD